MWACVCCNVHACTSLHMVRTTLDCPEQVPSKQSPRHICKETNTRISRILNVNEDMFEYTISVNIS